ncbi:MAG: sugar ABC transporter permease, partial [Pseudomonadota bacterium]
MTESTSGTAPPRKPVRWHIAVFLAPAVIVYTMVMIIPLFETLRLSVYGQPPDTEGNLIAETVFVGLGNYETLFFDPRWAEDFWNAFLNNLYFFFIHMAVQNPIGIAIAALLGMSRLRFRAFYRTAIFVPAMLSVVIIGFAWKLILSPLWGVSSTILGAVGLSSFFQPWLGLESTALTTLSLISV